MCRCYHHIVRYLTLSSQAAVFQRMLTMRSIDELIKLTEKPALLQTVGFGKHKGTRWRDLNSDYLTWVTRQDFGADELYTARHWLRSRKCTP